MMTDFGRERSPPARARSMSASVSPPTPSAPTLRNPRRVSPLHVRPAAPEVNVSTAKLLRRVGAARTVGGNPEQNRASWVGW